MGSEDAVAELAASLSVEDVPVKLRCATCSLIAYNALRLPCCEQNICEPCHKELVDVCQVCHHEPLDKSLCTPNKSLRTTTKVFLKRKLLEREKDQKKRDADSATAQVADTSGVAANPSASEVAATGEAQSATGQTSASVLPHSNKAAGGFPSGIEAEHSTEIKADVDRRPSEEGRGNAQADETFRRGGEHDTQVQEASAGAEQTGQWTQGGSQNMNQQQGFNQMNGMNNMGGFPMDMNAMMAMGAMPNMMGMGMDPMMMNAMASSMFGGFGGPNMGMGGMNMGMGQNQYGGPWMADQDSYNGNGNTLFGNQAGYNMPSHQGNFNQMNQQYPYNDFQSGYGRQGFYPRGGRGRRGGFRGGYGYQHHQGHMNQGNYSYGNNNLPISRHSQQQEVLETEKKDAQQPDVGETSLQPGSGQKEQNINEDTGVAASSSKEEDLSAEQEGQGAADSTASAMDTKESATDKDLPEPDKPMPIQSFMSDEPPSRNLISSQGNVPVGPSNVPAQGQRFAEPRAVGVPGAPTGPRALREGLPNTGRSGLAYSKTPNVQANTENGPSRTSRSPSPVKEQEDDQEQELVLDLEPDPDPAPHSRSPSRASFHSRSPSRERSDRRHSYRQRSRTRSRSRSNERQQGQNRSTYEEDTYGRGYHDGERPQSGRRESHQDHRAREWENEDSRSYNEREHDYGRESPKRRRDHNYDREYSYRRDDERHRARDDNYSRDDGDARYYDRRSRSPSQRRGSSLTREARKEGGSRKRRERDDEHEEDYEHGRGHNRRDRHRRKRSRRHRSVSRDNGGRHQPYTREDSKMNDSATPNYSSTDRRGSSAANTGSNPPTGSKESGRSRGDDRHRNRRPRRNSGSRPQQTSAEKATEKATEKDPHTLEREARDRERLMKEMQRRATADGGRGQHGHERRRSSAQHEGDSGAAPRKDRGGRRRR